MRTRRPLRHRTLPLVFGTLLLAGAVEARAGQLTWRGILNVNSSPTWQRPKIDLSGIAPGAPVLYTALSFFVDQSGIYQISAGSEFEAFPEAIYLYAERFDPAHPLDNLIAAANNGPAAAGTARLSLHLAAGVIYQLVTSLVAPPDLPEEPENTVSGPGQPRFSSCFLDEPERADANQELALNHGRFCVGVTWKDFAGHTGVGLPVGHRSDDSGLFYFFNPVNWELSVKVLDGCAINGRYWVFLSGSTNVGYNVSVQDLEAPAFRRDYSNALGYTATTVTDTDAFACSPCPVCSASAARAGLASLTGNRATASAPGRPGARSARP